MPVHLDGEDKAGADGLAIEQDRAGAAIAALAADLGTLEPKLIPQHVEEKVVRFHFDGAWLPIQLNPKRS
jgi:hypothetical protein